MGKSDVCLSRQSKTHSNSIRVSFRRLPCTFREVPASMIPLFGRTQYRRGAVVLTLKHTFLSVGLESLRFVVTTSENGPENGQQKETLDFQVIMSNVRQFVFFKGQFCCIKIRRVVYFLYSQHNDKLPYFPGYRTHLNISRTLIHEIILKKSISCRHLRLLNYVVIAYYHQYSRFSACHHNDTTY